MNRGIFLTFLQIFLFFFAIEIRSTLGGLKLTSPHQTTTHVVRSETGKTIDISTTFVPVARGQTDFSHVFYPQVTDMLGGLKGSFQSSAQGHVLDRNCYSIAIGGNAEARAIALASTMSGAPSLRNSGIQAGPGIALCPTGAQGLSSGGYLDFVFKTAPMTAFGSEIYVGRESKNAYPKYIFVQLQLEDDSTIAVHSAMLNAPGALPETRGTGANIQGYGHLAIESSVPFKRMLIGFKSKYDAENAMYCGGNIQLYSLQSLMDCPNLPFDQMGAIKGNALVYSAIALLPPDQQSEGTNQLLGLDCIEQLSKIPLFNTGASITGALNSVLNIDGDIKNADPIWDPKAFYSSFCGNQFRKSDQVGLSMGSDGAAEFFAIASEKSPTEKAAKGEKKTRTWIQPIMVRHQTPTAKTLAHGMWMGLNRHCSQRLSLGLFCGWMQEATKVLYNDMGMQSWCGGGTMTVQRQSDGLGPSATQQILFSHNRYSNTRSLPMFQLQAHQNYGGWSGATATLLKWTFSMPYKIHITPCGLFSYASTHRNKFQETMGISQGATQQDQLLAQNSALQFSAHFSSCMVLEGGAILKKHGDLTSWGKWNVWIYAAFGRIQSLKQQSYDVGFVGLSETFESVPKKIRRLYCAPMMGGSWTLPSGWSLGIGCRFQKSIARENQNQETTWSGWLVLDKCF